MDLDFDVKEVGYKAPSSDAALNFLGFELQVVVSGHSFSPPLIHFSYSNLHLILQLLSFLGLIKVLQFPCIQ